MKFTILLARSINSKANFDIITFFIKIVHTTVVSLDSQYFSNNLLVTVAWSWGLKIQINVLRIFKPSKER